jgi:hypothetical protein
MTIYDYIRRLAIVRLPETPTRLFDDGKAADDAAALKHLLTTKENLLDGLVPRQRRCERTISNNSYEVPWYHTVPTGMKRRSGMFLKFASWLLQISHRQ